MMASGRLLLACLLLGVVIDACTASRTPEVQGLVLRGDDGSSTAGPGTQRRRPGPGSHLQHPQQHQLLDDPSITNVEYAVDYSDENDPAYTSDEGEERAMEQVMTFSTYFPDQHQHQRRPCQHDAQHTQHAQHDVAAAADAADADVLVAAASHAWKKAQQVAARLAAADAAETAELVAELEATIERMTDAQDAASAVFDRRWDHFDGSLRSSFWSEAVADYINPARQYYSSSASGSDDYSMDESDADSSDGEDEQEEGADYDDAFGLLPGDQGRRPAGGDAHASTAAAQEGGGHVLDISSMLIAPEDNEANNLALFGVRTPEEVAAVAAAAAPATEFDNGSTWTSMLEWLSAAPFESVEPQKAAPLLLVGCTLMVFSAFLLSVVDLRAAVQPAAAAAAGSSSSGSGAAGLPAGAVLLHTRKSAFGGCSAVAAAAAAAAAAAVGAVQGAAAAAGEDGCGDLSRPLLLDAEDDVEAAVLQAHPSAGLPPALQKFYNPLHYQQLPDAE